MEAQTFLQLPPQLVEDSASNYGSSVAGDCFDEDFLSDAGRESPSNADSLAEDSDDEALPAALSLGDMARLRAMSYNRCRDHRCDHDRDANPDCDRAQDARDDRDALAVLEMGGGGSSVCQPLVSILPRGTRPVRLVGEGAANAVFEIKLPPSSRAGAQFQGKLLRVAKAQVLGRTPTPSDYYLRQQEFFVREIQPHLGEHAVRQELVVLHKSGIVDELNAMLRDVNHLRKPKFQGSVIGHGFWGFLVEDMRPNGASAAAAPPQASFSGTNPPPVLTPSRGDDGSMLVEFKPKWLLQSPSAPKNAIRCRQCALELRNYLKNPGARPPRPERRLCPIALANPDCPQQVASPFRIAPQLSGRRDDKHVRALLDKIIHHEAIRMLRDCQKSLDRAGPLRLPTNLDFVVAMTLRDCTCFALVPAGDGEEIKLRFGDFDWKDPEAKFNHWRGTEQDLIDGGFYTADWVVCGDSYYHPPSLCALEWSGKPRAGEPVVIVMEENAPRHSKHSGPQSSDVSPSTGRKRTVYRHKTDLAALQKGLEPFKRDAGGAPSDSIYNNPLRCDP
ncbi:inositol-pentakisphosphate 2-kinase [Trichoderma cornu-damae]|uniref:Inositol-pentakisphosphate 2-kinase n=1 Tax=Trichoderma cornu-damae TaxID=654480 RepID=A0A9P8QX86_9HYPO|nr:inositol-pentakisphosphate 2-kinase [Trichoderma cornu-damae]